MNSKRLTSIIVQLFSSGILYYIVYKFCQVPVSVYNYYFAGKTSYLTKVPDIQLDDLFFALSIFQIVYLFIQLLFFLACYFPMMNFMKRKFLARKKPQVKMTSIDDMSRFFNKSNAYFNAMKQQKRYTVSGADELPNEKMNYLSKRKLAA